MQADCGDLGPHVSPKAPDTGTLVMLAKKPDRDTIPRSVRSTPVASF